MIKVLTKSGNVANLLKVTTSVGGSNIVPAASAVPEEKNYLMPYQRAAATPFTFACGIPTKRVTIVSGPSAKYHVRFGHTDVKVPDFSYYRRKSCANPNVNNHAAKDNERLYLGITAGIGGAAAIYGTKTLLCTFLGSLSMSAKVMALGKIEIKKSDIPEGKNITFKWRGKPLFVRHRTDEEIKKENAVDVKSLRDPQHDNERVKDPKWLVVVGVCTHLGCIPVPNQGLWGGYFCPCHGSHYDFSGRIRKGPAPLNLEVPPYDISSDMIVVG